MLLFHMKDWQLTLDEQVWGLKPFKVLLDRDKTKEKTVANAEMLFIWFFTDIKSDMLFLPEKERIEEIKKNIEGLPKDWEIDEAVQNAIDFYNKSSETIIQQLYKNSLKAAQAVGEYLANTEALLNERDSQDRPVYDIKKITNSLRDVKIIMRDLKEAEKEVIKERIDNEGRQKGSQTFNMFEDGI